MGLIKRFNGFLSHAFREYRGIPWYVIAASSVYLFSLLFIAFIGFYVVPDALFIVSFIVLLPGLKKALGSPAFGQFREMKNRDRLIVLFVFALLLRGVLLVNSQVITNDIDLYVERSSALVNGSIPYVDTAMHKPPMYAYMLYLLGETLGPGHLQFRAFFSVVDSALAVGVYFLLRKKYSDSYAYYGALAYALCPINVISTGLEGHYDPLVSIFVVGALYLYFEKRNSLSSLGLGLAFAFKLYPFIFAPFLVWKLKTWRERVVYSVLFFIPMALSFLPLYLINPNTWEIYWSYQSGEWMNQAMKSFAKAYELLTGSHHIFGMTYTDFFLYFFLGMVGLMFLSWVWSRLEKKDIEWWFGGKRFYLRPIPHLIPKSVREWLENSVRMPVSKRKEKVFLFWYRVIFVTFVVYYGSQIVTGFLLYKGDFHKNLGISDPWAMVYLSAAVYFGLAGAFLYRFRDYLFPKSMAVPEREELFVLGAFSIMFLLFGSPDYPTWYIMWYIPLVLGIHTDTIRNLLFAVMLWNIPGEGIRLWPGKAIAKERY